MGAAQGARREQISFVDALRHLRWLLTVSAPPDLWVKLLRSERSDPRVRKRRASNYAFMVEPRTKLRQGLLTPKDAG